MSSSHGVNDSVERLTMWQNCVSVIELPPLSPLFESLQRCGRQCAWHLICIWQTDSLLLISLIALFYHFIALFILSSKESLVEVHCLWSSVCQFHLLSSAMRLYGARALNNANRMLTASSCRLTLNYCTAFMAMPWSAYPDQRTLHAIEARIMTSVTLESQFVAQQLVLRGLVVVCRQICRQSLSNQQQATS